ncbi:hypothetical protein EJ110_NYTH03974 [Nymphaea thermarum]|nr:hypothetical protein EJ110_NYTH03974 [Nymphaea thermarum]
MGTRRKGLLSVWADGSLENARPEDPQWKGLGGFLERCFLCKRRLQPSHDIYMYRDFRAFCSIDCRQAVIEKEEKASKDTLVARSAANGTSSSNCHIETDNVNVKEPNMQNTRNAGHAAA